MLGDNAYTNGTDAEYQGAVFDTYADMLQRSVLWPAFGNHDALSASSVTQSGPYYDIFSLPRAGEAGGIASGTEAYFSFDYANIHFIVLNSEDTLELDSVKHDQLAIQRSGSQPPGVDNRHVASRAIQQRITQTQTPRVTWCGCGKTSCRGWKMAE